MEFRGKPDFGNPDPTRIVWRAIFLSPPETLVPMVEIREALCPGFWDGPWVFRPIQDPRLPGYSPSDSHLGRPPGFLNWGAFPESYFHCSGPFPGGIKFPWAYPGYSLLPGPSAVLRSLVCL